MTLQAWRQQVFGLAIQAGWFPALRIEGNFPSLVLVRERVIFAELKRMGKDPTTEQSCWLHLLREAGAEAYLWRPSDFEDVRGVLTRRAA